jgi:hypothetical protein
MLCIAHRPFSYLLLSYASIYRGHTPFFSHLNMNCPLFRFGDLHSPNLTNVRRHKDILIDDEDNALPGSFFCFVLFLILEHYVGAYKRNALVVVYPPPIM